MNKGNKKYQNTNNNCSSSVGVQLLPESRHVKQTVAIERVNNVLPSHSFNDSLETSSASLKKTHTTQPGNTPLDTLAQLRKHQQNQHPQNSNISNNTVYKRAKAKYISCNLALKLKDLRSPLEKSYFKTFGCASLLKQQDGKLTGRYCNNRWCLVCNRIRTAKLIKGYKTPLSELKDPYFVTLTTPNVTGSDLRAHLLYMTSVFRKIKDKQRKAKQPIIGIRKIECTYNKKRHNFNPHFHLIVDGEQTAETIINEWLNRIEGTSKDAQDSKPADEDSIYELFKYFTKIIYKGGTKVQALDTIFQAMYGLRTFQAMGIKKISEDIEELQSDIYAEIDSRETEWIWCENDWIDVQTGEYLTNYEPPEAAKQILEGFECGKSYTPLEPLKINMSYYN